MFYGAHRRGGRSLVALLATVATLVLSQVVAVAADSDKAVARGHYETATRLYELREYGKALDEYKAAYLAKPDPAFLFNIGQCHRKLGNTSEALNFYQQYLKKIPADDPNRAQAEARIHDIETGRDSEEDPFAKPGREGGTSTSQPDKREPETPARISAVRPSARTMPEPPGVALPGASDSSPTQPIVGFPTPASTRSTPPAIQLPGKPELGRPQEILLVTPTQPKTPSSIYTRWWFWTGIGVAVVAGTVATFALSRGGGSNAASTTLGTQGAFQ
jgi:hypothetical protein